MQKGINLKLLYWKWSLWFFYLFLGISSIAAQDLSYRQFTVEDGLPSNQIYDVHQDQKGFIWFATENGLSRYNGEKFINYTLSDGLPDTEILSFFEDSKKRLWFCAFNGELGFYLDGVFHNSKNTDFLEKDSLNNSIVNAIEDKEGNIYFSYDQLIIQINSKNELTKLDAKPHSVLVKDIHGQVYAYIRNKDHHSNLSLLKVPQLEFTLFESVNFDIENKYALFFYGATDFSEVHLVSPSLENKFRPKKNHFVLEKNNSYWLSSPTSSLQILTKNEDDLFALQYELDNLSLSKGILDQENSIWYGSLGKGAFRFDQSNTLAYRLGGNLKGALLSSLFIDKSTNRIYCGSSDGILNVISEKGIRNIEIGHQDQTSSRIRDIEKDSFDRLWLTCDVSLLAYNTETFELEDIGNIKTNMGAPKDVTIDHKNNQIIIANNYQTIKFKFDGKKFYRRESLLEKRSICVHVDEDDRIWSGTAKGLYSYPIDGEENKIKHIGEYPISCINHLNKTILAGTKGKGLLVINGDSIRNISIENGLPSNLIRSIQISDDQSVWVSTNQGLCKIENIHEPSFSIQIINEENGLISNDVIDCGFIDTTLYVLCSNGLSVLNFSEINNNFISPRINLEQILVNDKNIPVDSIQELTSIQNNLSFLFSGIHFGNRNDFEYSYKLTGYHKRWHKTKNDNLVFEYLSPGKYSLKIHASVNGKSSDVEIIKFEIIPAFYQRMTVRLLGLGLLFFGIFMSTRCLIAREKKKNRIEKRLLQLEQMALQSQMNPHFIKNSLGAIQHLMIKKDVRTANKYLTVFGELITQLLQQSDQSQIKINEEIKILELYLSIEKLRFDNNFKYQMIYDSKEILDQKIPSMMIQPLVENAVIHGFRDSAVGRENKLKIYLEFQNDYLTCMVEDNGSGIKATTLTSSIVPQKEGIAMYNIRERISLLAIKKPNTTFEILRTNEKGTLIKLCLPISENYD